MDISPSRNSFSFQDYLVLNSCVELPLTSGRDDLIGCPNKLWSLQRLDLGSKSESPLLGLPKLDLYKRVLTKKINPIPFSLTKKINPIPFSNPIPFFPRSGRSGRKNSPAGS